MTDQVRVINAMIPGACPPLPDGPPVSLVKSTHSHAYIAHYGALPPWWNEKERDDFEMDRDDAVMIRWRHGSRKTDRDNAYRWLLRYGLDTMGVPRVWSTRGAPPARDVPELAAAR